MDYRRLALNRGLFLLPGARMSSPLDFADNFLKQPYPTMGLAPSAVPIKTGGTVVQSGSGSDGVSVTGDSMWGRIASAIPFGWSAASVLGIAKATTVATDTVKQKTEEGAQAVQGKVKSAVKTISIGTTELLSGITSYTKWIVIGAVALAFIVFAAQVKTLVKS